MRITNKTQNFVISEAAVTARSFSERLRGLLFTRKSDLVIVSPTCDEMSSAIHTVGMTYPIHVLWLDEEKQVVDTAHAKPFNILKPSTWRIYKPINPAKYVVEIGAGTIGKTRVGDEITFN